MKALSEEAAGRRSVGWRRPPFRREPPPVDYTGWTDEQIAAEIGRRFGTS